MQSQDLDVLTTVRTWINQGYGVVLHTVVQTFGSAPRPPGALMAVRNDGIITGSVSGGCIEDDLIGAITKGDVPALPRLLTWGITAAEAARFRLPCGGTIRLLQESVTETGWIDAILDATRTHRMVRRRLVLATGQVRLEDIQTAHDLRFDGATFEQCFGPRWRLLLIGSGDLSRLTAEMARALDFDVLICDPRSDFAQAWDVEGTRLISGMPDDVVEDLHPDRHTAIVALTHDPKLDDMALMTALKSDAFYVGALGSNGSTERRRERLLTLDITPEELSRLRGPVGLDLGSRAPAEIAIAILAEIIAVKNDAPIIRTRSP